MSWQGAIAQGMKGGIVAASGLAVGSFFHVLAAVFGLSAIFQHSPILYFMIKILGTFYLIYLGIKLWRNRTNNASNNLTHQRDTPELKNLSLVTVFKESIIVEITNPKTALFFIAFLPQFVDPSIGSVTLQLLTFGIIVTLSALPCDLLVAFFPTR
ncbi:MAG: threonine/homoserine/homoserine lactone efflux protein [Flavobacterium sp.]|jgi:threonine/homoserine/homoserine lactone efflux protein